MQVIPNLFSAHMDPEEWDNPSEFRPERFIGADGKLLKKDRVMPFSTGMMSDAL
jgi:cytochrome P450